VNLYKRVYRDKKTGETRQTKTWTAQFTVAGRRYQIPTGHRDKKLARTVALAEERRLAEEAAAKKAGLPVVPDVAKVDLRDLVREFGEMLERLGRAEKHVALTMRRVAKIVGRSRRAGELTAEKIRRRLDRLQVAPRTRNYYRTALNRFFGWLVSEKHWPENPVTHVETVKVTDKTRERRALTVEEVDRLLEVSPGDRSLVYHTAVATGLRRGELEKLQWRDLDLDAQTVTVRASIAKSSKAVTLPLEDGVAERLRHYAQGRSLLKRALVFPDGVPSIAMLRHDLAAAGIEYETEMGFADFHSLRITFVTTLARANVPLALAQRLARHSTPVLTSNVYSRLELHDAAEAVSRLSFSAPTVREQARA
jgi:integrase